MALLHPPRGMHDLLPSDCEKHLFIREMAKCLASRSGFREISTPLLEFKEVFKRTLGTTSDVISKEMYEISSKNGEELVLRPEGTAGIARAVLSNGLSQTLPLKFFYHGPMFRHERPQKGRLRQFHHVGVELLGVASPLGDVEILSLAYDFLKTLHLEQRVCLEINSLGDQESRENYRALLIAYLKDHVDKLSPESQDRLTRNPLRILDSKDERDRDLLSKAPCLASSLTSFSEDMFARVQEGLHALKIPFVLSPYLVRGLDYYCHLAFEFTTKDLGAQGTVLAGGRYDGLTTTMGGAKIPGVGWAAGVERLAMMLETKSLPLPPRPLAIVVMEEALSFKGLCLAQTLRQEGFVVEMTYDPHLGKSLKKANKMGAFHALILGGEETGLRAFSCKNLDSGEQSSVPEGRIVDFLKSVYPKGGGLK